MAEIDAPQDVRAAVATLTVEKARTRELGEAPAPPALLAFVEAEFAAAERWAGVRAGEGVPDEARAEAVALYRRRVEEVSG